jgi:hypothetical protein
MTWEVLKDSQGSDVDSRGIPYSESLTTREANRLRFRQWVDENKVTDLRTPQTPLPQPTQIHRVDAQNAASLGEFFERHRKRGPYKKYG